MDGKELNWIARDSTNATPTLPSDTDTDTNTQTDRDRQTEKERAREREKLYMPGGKKTSVTN